jgi:ABC-type molybdenum transport system ATPase subunit/photorepair protein PhrA
MSAGGSGVGDAQSRTGTERGMRSRPMAIAGSSARQRAHLVATGVHIERGGQPVLTAVTLAVSRGTRLGIVGENGRCRSTLLHICLGRCPRTVARS